MNPNIPSVMDIENLPGFGFFPEDECLINVFLSRKNSNQPKNDCPILEIDLCKLEPRDLLGRRTAGCQRYLYFYHRRQYADERKQSYKRRTETGYWKSTGKPREIKGGGTKRSLAFYEKGSARGSKEVRTGHIMHEYANGGQYVILRLQRKVDKTKKSKLSHQNISTDDSVEENQMVIPDSEVVHPGFEDQSPQGTMVMAVHEEGEETSLMAPVCNKNSSSTEFGGPYESPSASSDINHYDQSELTANYSACQYNEVMPSHFVDQNWKGMTIVCQEGFSSDQSELTANYSACQYNEVMPPHFADQNWKDMIIVCREGFSSETENQSSNNESEGDSSPLVTSPYYNFQNKNTFNGEGAIFSPNNFFDIDLSRYNYPAATIIDSNYWWDNPEF